jgi:hypothetical protein
MPGPEAACCGFCEVVGCDGHIVFPAKIDDFEVTDIREVAIKNKDDMICCWFNMTKYLNESVKIPLWIQQDG